MIGERRTRTGTLKAFPDSFSGYVAFYKIAINNVLQNPGTPGSIRFSGPHDIPRVRGA